VLCRVVRVVNELSRKAVARLLYAREEGLEKSKTIQKKRRIIAQIVPLLK